MRPVVTAGPRRKSSGETASRVGVAQEYDLEAAGAQPQETAVALAPRAPAAQEQDTGIRKWEAGPQEQDP